MNRNAELEQILSATEGKLVEKDEYIEQMEKTVLDIEMEKNQLMAKLERKSADLEVIMIIKMIVILFLLAPPLSSIDLQRIFTINPRVQQTSRCTRCSLVKISLREV